LPFYTHHTSLSSPPPRRSADLAAAVCRRQPSARQADLFSTLPLGLDHTLKCQRDGKPVKPSRFHHSSAAGEIARKGSPPSMKSRDRKSTRLNSSHAKISYAVFC